MNHPVDLLRSAIEDAAPNFAKVATHHLDLPTPCEAWESTDDLETPRVTPMGPMPPAGILLFGAQDIFVHAWDVATTIGVTPELSDEMIEVFTRTHRESIDEAMRAMFFADAVPVPDHASALDQLVAFLGRRPSATAPAAADRVVAV